MRTSIVKLLFCLLLTSFSAAVLASCAHTNGLTGTWREAGKKSTIEFHADGTFYAVDDMEMAVHGKYFLQENGFVRFDIAHEGAAHEIIHRKLILQGDELTLISADSKETEKYKKVR
jgi:hypothetical protein